MSAPRLVSVTLLLLAACAGWEASSPNYTPPPEDPPSPSHYAPPPPGDPREPVATPGPARGDVKVAIASVQLIQDCPDPAPAPSAGVTEPSGGVTNPSASSQRAAPSAERAAGAMAKSQAGDTPDGVPWSPPCDQSMVQISVQSAFAGPFRVVGVRVLDAGSKQVAGTAKLRGPLLWDNTTGYRAWDERTVAGSELKISYKLGDPEFTDAAQQLGPSFNTFGGPFMLELDVTIGGERRTIRSPEFTREPPHVVVT